MSSRAIRTTSAPEAIGPYSQGVVAPAGRMIFLSGQIPLDPETGAMVEGDIRAQTRRVMDNLEAVLRAAGLGWEAVVRTTIFLVDLQDFTAVNEVYASYFGGEPPFPSRATVQVARLPKDARVEISAIAVQ